MDIPPPDEYREELKQIAQIIDAPDSRPGQQIRAKRTNSADPWKEEEDAKRFAANLSEHLDDFDAASEQLARQAR